MQRDRVPNVTNASEDLQRRPHGSLPGVSLESSPSTMVLSVVGVLECVKSYMVDRKRLLNEPPRWSGMLKTYCGLPSSSCYLLWWFSSSDAKVTGMLRLFLRG